MVDAEVAAVARPKVYKIWGPGPFRIEQKPVLMEAMGLKLKDVILWWDTKKTDWVKASVGREAGVRRNIGHEESKVLLVKAFESGLLPGWTDWFEAAENENSVALTPEIIAAEVMDE